MRVMPLLPILALMTACSQKEEAPAEPTVHEIMKDRIDLHADEVWELSNPALDNDAQIDASRLTEAQWDEIALRATAVADAANELASLKTLVLVKPGVKIADEDVEGGTSSEKVQALLDERPDDFRQFAGVLAAHMTDLAAAAKARDAARMTPLVDQLDGVCESCHLEFWYPDQKALVESIRQAGGDDPAK